MEFTLKKLLNALFPNEDEEKQILNKKTVKTLGKLGPAIGLTTILFLFIVQTCGSGTIPQGFILFNLSLFVAVFLFFSRKLKQKKRNPVIFFLLILYASLMSLFGLKIATARQASWDRINREWRESAIVREAEAKKRDERWEAIKQRQEETFKQIKTKSKAAQAPSEENQLSMRRFEEIANKGRAEFRESLKQAEKKIVRREDPYQKKQQLEWNLSFKAIVLSKVDLISDKESMRRQVDHIEAFHRGKRKNVVGHEKILEDFFQSYERQTFAANFKDYEMTEEQSKLLAKFYEQSKAYIKESLCRPYDMTAKDPEWQKIQDLGKEVLNLCSYERSGHL